MKTFFTIVFWEFFRHFRSRSFLLATFVSPLLFAAIILIPPLFLGTSSSDQSQVVGCVEFDTTAIFPQIKERLSEVQRRNTANAALHFVNLIPDTSTAMRSRFENQAVLKTNLDSLEESYTKIKERRKYVFQKPKTNSREVLLKETYEDLIRTRELRDLAEVDFRKTKAQNDSLWEKAFLQQADQMLRRQEIQGYLIIDPDQFYDGSVEFHSIYPINFLEIEPLKQALQIVIVENRMKQEGVRVGKIQEWLKSVDLKEIQLQGEQKQEFDFVISYLGPIIVVLFLFISIFTSSEFLFNGVIKEKTNRVLEILLSSVSHGQLVAGKIVGLGILGIFQILIWFVLTIGLVGFGIINLGEIAFLTFRNAGLFLLYFILGYLFFASIFVGIGSLFSSEEDAHHLNQFMRMLSIFPIVLAVLVIEIPNSLLVRILSFIPPLTPTFMILRTPLGNPPAIDYYISISIMVLSIAISIYFAGKMFRLGSLLYGKKPSVRNIFQTILPRHSRN